MRFRLIHRARHRALDPRGNARRVAVGAVAVAAAAAALAGPALARTGHRSAPPAGAVVHAYQNSGHAGPHRLWVAGWAYDPAHPARSIGVDVYVDGHRVAHTTALRPSSARARSRHHTGRPWFSVTVTRAAWAHRVQIRSRGTSATAPMHIMATQSVAHDATAGQRITAVAARYVGHARYVEGGSSPDAGFDCSGYTRWVYRAAAVARLPHSAEGQRRLPRMHAVSRTQARPGDLVFYLGGGSAYHVAVYAGHGMQYAAATERDGIRYQPVWSNAVQYRHYR